MGQTNIMAPYVFHWQGQNSLRVFAKDALTESNPHVIQYKRRGNCSRLKRHDN